MSGRDATQMSALVRQELLRLARLEDDLAAAEAESVPYWAACPHTVVGHRYAAAALRANAEEVGAGGGVEHRQIGAGACQEAASTIDWDSPAWGGGVTYAADGSWVPDRHDRPGRIQR